ncbi:MerR family transcriptional regulator [Colwellia sp. BRX8-7]|jgi:DNA-binding transcriptional MerR regulator|uniref:MerR family transcriptional regulator n=1 Tax=Colwellia sp. BRX8-7 TaxID=2759833 RepID=UPI0015F49EDF|nr:MerR family transcriptional regulator [Colwellia sp. BRX8-7]MBA6337467.1 MerR family transcriptional regulator [Colwellia sp. BRX8-7]
MKISELAKISGITASTIRFYEAKGLLPKIQRNINGYRHYSQDSVQRLATIECAKRLGFKLADILNVLADSGGVTEGLDHNKIVEQLDIRLLEAESLIKGLLAQRDEIVLFKQRLQESWQQGKCLAMGEILSADKR